MIEQLFLFYEDSGSSQMEVGPNRGVRQIARPEGLEVCARRADLYSIDPNIHNQPDAETKSAILRLTAKDEETARRYFLTFKTLAGLANFEPKPEGKQPDNAKAPIAASLAAPVTVAPLHGEDSKRRKSEFHYNIQLHLPVTTDITVYNAIFKSLKENLDI